LAVIEAWVSRQTFSEKRCSCAVLIPNGSLNITSVAFPSRDLLSSRLDFVVMSLTGHRIWRKELAQVTHRCWFGFAIPSIGCVVAQVIYLGVRPLQVPMPFRILVLVSLAT
jgi:hypothetical protein